MNSYYGGRSAARDIFLSADVSSSLPDVTTEALAWLLIAGDY